MANQFLEKIPSRCSSMLREDTCGKVTASRINNESESASSQVHSNCGRLIVDVHLGSDQTELGEHEWSGWNDNDSVWQYIEIQLVLNTRPKHVLISSIIYQCRSVPLTAAAVCLPAAARGSSRRWCDIQSRRQEALIDHLFCIPWWRVAVCDRVSYGTRFASLKPPRFQRLPSGERQLLMVTAVRALVQIYAPLSRREVWATEHIGQGRPAWVLSRRQNYHLTKLIPRTWWPKRDICTLIPLKQLLYAVRSILAENSERWQWC